MNTVVPPEKKAQNYFAKKIRDVGDINNPNNPDSLKRERRERESEREREREKSRNNKPGVSFNFASVFF